MKNLKVSRRSFLCCMSLCAAMALQVTLTGCGSAPADKNAAATSDFKVEMITDEGGINDQSFNQSSWEGLKKLQKDGANVHYLESKQKSDYKTNFDKAIDVNPDLVWGVGYALAPDAEEAAKINPDMNFAVIDFAFQNPPKNLTGVMFRAQEPSFMVGYAAAMKTKTDHVGYVGGIKSDFLDQFEYGYRAGVAYGAKQRGKDIKVDVEYANSFNDAAKGKAIAQKMYQNGADIIFHAAGGTGVGVISAAKNSGEYVIGVDRDQAYLNPDHVLTSALKKVGNATYQVSLDLKNGKRIGGKNLDYGLKENAVGIPEDHKLLGDEIYNNTLKIGDEIKEGKITPPANEKDFDQFVKNLNN